MGMEWRETEIGQHPVRDPIFMAMDLLRQAMDRSLDDGDDRVAGLLQITLHDLADTVDLTTNQVVMAPESSWLVCPKKEP